MENLVENPIGLVLIGIVLIYWATLIKKEDEKITRAIVFILGLLALISGVVFLLLGGEQSTMNNTSLYV